MTGAPAPEPPDSPPPPPSLPRQLSAVLLLAAGLSLLVPVFGGPAPSPRLVAALLGARLALQLWDALSHRRAGSGTAAGPLPWPSLALTGVLIALLLFAPGSQGGK